LEKDAGEKDEETGCEAAQEMRDNVPAGEQ
jgi:hypothetical protein